LKKTASSSQPYEVPTSQPLTESSSKDRAESFNCNKCAESLLQCEYCSTWYCFKCCDIPEEMFSTIGCIKNLLHWFCSTCDVIIAKFITKSNPSGVHSVLKDTISTVIHQSLDRAMSQFVKMFTEKTDQLEKSLNQMVHGIEETNMDMLQNSDLPNPAAAVNINQPQGHTVLEAVDKYVEREKHKNNLIFYNLPEPTNVSSNDQQVLKDIECLSDLISSERGISKVQVNHVIQLGAPNQTKPRLLLVQLADISTKRAILRQEVKLQKVSNGRTFMFH